jgi:DNA-binding transcriptional MocR family regulator
MRTAGKEPKYVRLANLLEDIIRNCSFRPGDRVPSVRQFSSQHGVSIPTALQAYVTLETRGLIEARPRSGYYVRARQADFLPDPSSAAVGLRTTNFTQTYPIQSVLLSEESAKLIPLGAALPGPDLLPGIKLARTMSAIGRRLGAASVSYDPLQGSGKLREVLARRSLEWGCALKASDFTITSGATEAMSLALRSTCQPGDTVIVESPTYWGLVHMLRELRLKAWPVPVDSVTGMDLDYLEKGLRRLRASACVLIPSFHNPVGFLMPDENKRRLVEMLAGRTIPVIEDDIYGDLQHKGARPRCLKAFDTDGSVLLCSSFSKTLAPGYRVGYIAAGRWQSKVHRLKAGSTLSCATLPVLAVAEFLKTGGYDRYLRTVRQAYREQVEQMREAIVEMFPAGIALSRPQGGFLLWCQLPAKVDSIKLSEQARSAGISVAPGPLFSPYGGCRNYIRVNCGHRLTPQIERGLAVLGKLVRKMILK